MVLPLLHDINSFLGARPLTMNTRGSWLMLDSDNTIRDESGNGFDGKLLSTENTKYLGNKGIDLNNSFITIDDRRIWSNIYSWTIGGYFKFHSLLGNQVLWSSMSTGNKYNTLDVSLKDNQIRVVVYDIEGSMSANVLVPDLFLSTNVNYFISLSYNHGSEFNIVYLIINDRIIPIYLPDDIRAAFTQSTKPLQIGHRMNGSNRLNAIVSKFFLDDRFNTPESLVDFYKSTNMVDLSNIDLLSNPGSLILKNANTPGKYISPVMSYDVNNRVATRLQLSGRDNLGDIIVETRSGDSLEEVANNPWEFILGDNLLPMHENQSMVQLRTTLVTKNKNYPSPEVSSMILLDENSNSIIDSITSYLMIYDSNGRNLARLEHLEELTLKDEVNGNEELNFKINDPKKASMLENEYIVDVHYKGQYDPYNRFVIRTIDDSDSSEGVSYNFMCEPMWSNIAYLSTVGNINLTNISPLKALQTVLAGSDWSASFVSSSFTLGDYIVEEKKNRLEHIRAIQELWGGDIVFDNIHKTVSLYNENTDTGFAIRRRKNMTSIKRKRSTSDLVTILTPYGKDNLTIASVNNGVEELYNYSWFTERGEVPPKRYATWSDNRFTNALNLKNKGIKRLASMCAPVFSYEVEILNVSSSIYSNNEIPPLRSLATLIDEEQNNGGITKLKIVSRNLDLLDPLSSRITLSTRLREIGDNALYADVSDVSLTTQRLAYTRMIGDSPFDGTQDVPITVSSEDIEKVTYSRREIDAKVSTLEADINTLANKPVALSYAHRCYDTSSGKLSDNEYQITYPKDFTALNSYVASVKAKVYDPIGKIYNTVDLSMDGEINQLIYTTGYIKITTTRDDISEVSILMSRLE